MSPTLVWTPSSDTHELAVRFRGAPQAEVPTAVMDPYAPAPRVTRYARRSPLAGMSGHLRASWRQANLSIALLVAAGAGLIGSRLIEAVAAVTP